MKQENKLLLRTGDCAKKPKNQEKLKDIEEVGKNLRSKENVDGL